MPYIKRVQALEHDNFPTGGDEGPMVKIAAGSGKNILLISGTLPLLPSALFSSLLLFSTSFATIPPIPLPSSLINPTLLLGPPNPHWIKYREVTSQIDKDRFGEDSMVGQMFQQTWKTTQELSVTHFGPKEGQPLDLFKELYHVMVDPLPLFSTSCCAPPLDLLLSSPLLSLCFFLVFSSSDSHTDASTQPRFVW